METFLKDLRHGLRTMRKAPAFTAGAILILAFGCAVNTAIFSVVNAIVIQPLPFKDSSELVTVWEKKYAGGGDWYGVSSANYVDWTEQASVFQSVSAVQNWNVTYGGKDGGEPLLGVRCTSNFFPMLGVEAKTGRIFSAEEDRPGYEHVVVLGYPFWKRAFAGDQSIVGKTIRLNRENYTVLGILPEDFQFASQQVELFAPLALPRTSLDRENRNNLVFARLKLGVSLESAGAAMDALAHRLAEEYPQTNSGYGVSISPMHDFFVNRRDLKTILLLVQLSVGFLLLISCANVANLLLVRTAGRQREFSIRAALGANRARMIRQVLTESIALAMVAGLVGLLLSFLFFRLLVQITPYIPTFRPNALVIDGPVLVFTLAISIATGLVFGLGPALHASRIDVHQRLKEGGRSGTMGSAEKTAGKLLIVLQISLAMLLLICATLTTKSFMIVQRANPGFQTANILTMQVSLTGPKYRGPSDYADFFEKLLRNVRLLPEVKSAGVTSQLPLAGIALGATKFSIEGQASSRPGGEPMANNRVVDDQYFPSIGIPLVAGRFFSEQDDDKGVRVAIVNQTFVRRFLQGDTALGRRIKLGRMDDQGEWYSIIGVIGDVKDVGLDIDSNPEIYRVYRQAAVPAMSLVLHVNEESAGLIRPLRKEVSQLDPDIPLAQVRTMDQVVFTSVAPRRFSMLLLIILALASFILSVAGVYGVISYSVVQRQQEIGIRIALGAQTRNIFRLILQETALLIAIGVGIGFAFALIGSKLIARLLYKVSPVDPVSFAVVIVVFFVVGQLAGFMPAWRATKLDPKTVLQSQ
ncbi:MAG TPA: ABC transporter permease [Candidatus Angelobacter sp.]|nr:ABC transporter permease [Candidatus Angelobacter sp.]